jgi:hypothetical protein
MTVLEPWNRVKIEQNGKILISDGKILERNIDEKINLHT